VCKLGIWLLGYLPLGRGKGSLLSQKLHSWAGVLLSDTQNYSTEYPKIAKSTHLYGPSPETDAHKQRKTPRSCGNFACPPN